MVNYFDALRAEVSTRGVGVTVVVPGYIATEHAASALGRPSDGAGIEKPRGVPPEALAAQIADRVAGGDSEILVSQPSGRFAVLLRALWPNALFRILQRQADL